MNKTSNLFSKHGIIELLEIPKVHTPNRFRRVGKAPFDPMNFLWITITPLKILDHCLNIFIKTNQKLKNTHRVNRDRLDQRLKYYLFARLRQEPFLPPLHPSPYPFFDLSKTCHPISANKRRKLQIFLIMLNGRNIKCHFDSFLWILIHIPAKE